MATVIDALVVTLGLDPKQWTQGQKDAVAALKKTEAETTRTAKEMEARGKQAAGFFGQIKNQVLGLATAFLSLSGIKSFIQNVTASDQATGRLATNLQISTTRLSAWEGVAKRFGSSKDDIDATFRSMQNLAKMVELMGTLPDEQNLALVKLGVNVAKFVDQTTTVEQKTRMLQEAFAKANVADAQFWGQKLGVSEHTINFLRETNSRMDELLATQEKLNVVTNEDDANARLRTRSWSDFLDTSQRRGKDILNLATPTGVRLLDTWMQASQGFNYLYDKATGQIDAGRAASSTSFPLRPTPINSSRPTPTTPSSGQIRRPPLVGPPLASEASYLSSLETKYKLPPGLLDSVWKQESGRGWAMLSRAGAKGHFGFMDKTAKQYGLKDPNNFRESADASARLFKDLLAQHNGDLPSALAAYNWGSDNLQKKGMGRAPLETRKYLSEVQSRMPSVVGSGGSSTTNFYGDIIVNSKATDAAGVARDMKLELRNYGVGVQAAPGLN